MRALYFDKKLHYRPDMPDPIPPPGEALIRTRLAGVCNTDLEIVRGYLGFTGVLGHEFVGEVVRADDAPRLVGQRVVGEINAYCGECPTCRRGDPTHCRHDGCRQSHPESGFHRAAGGRHGDHRPDTPSPHGSGGSAG